MTNEILVIARIDPDLDGVASVFAYTEYLKKKGLEAVAGIFGTSHIEAQFVLHRLGARIEDAKILIKRAKDVRLMDYADEPFWLEKNDIEKITELIDHRKVHFAHKFPNAKVQIELVGACATLIAEKFFEDKIAISKKSAELIYGAIVSNTINFKANVTTNRDRKIADWLKKQVKIPDSFIREMFAAKSHFDKTVKEIMMDDYAAWDFCGKKSTIFQLEILNAEEFVRQHLNDIKKSLREIKKEQGVDSVFLTVVDLEKGYNVLVVGGIDCQKIVESALGAKFKNGIAIHELMMRKEIVPYIKEYFESEKCD